MFDLCFAIGVNVFLWTYLVCCLFGAKKIEYECSTSSKVVIFIFFIGCGLLIYLRLPNMIGALSLASFLLASAIYHIIPSGFCEDGIIVAGRYYPFNKISDVDLKKENGHVLLTFVYKHKPHILFGTLDQYQHMKAYCDLYYKKGVKR